MSERAEPSKTPVPPPWWAPLAIAWSFLTVLPAPWIEASPATLSASLALFPVIGTALGVLLGGLGLLLDRFLPAGPVAALILGVEVFATGGLHLDGLMDTADGVFGGRTRERRLEIMRDSRVGSFGALAGALVLIAQFACLSDLSGMPRLVALAVTLGFGRWSMVVAMRAFQSARAAGLGATFQAGAGWRPILVATIFSGAAAIAAGRLGLIGFGCVAFCTFLGGRFLAARLGGLTGDTYGGIATIAESITLFIAVAFNGR